mgnify:CR=1 FL=1
MEDINENSIIQTHRNDADNNDADPIELEFPLTRIKLMVSKNGQIAVDTWDNASKAFKSKPNVFDARKMTAKNEYKPTLATVKVDGKSRPLDSDNAGTFISYRSVLGGQIEFPEIIISKVGFSLSNKFLDVFVRRNKSNLQEATFSKDDLKEMAGDEDEDGGPVPAAEVLPRSLRPTRPPVGTGALRGRSSMAPVQVGPIKAHVRGRY